jgi:pilus assembly protein CpaB
MRPANLIMFGIAFLCAGIAAFLMRGLLQRAPATAFVQPAETIKLLVAARDIKPGEKLAAEAVREVEWPQGSIPRGAFLSKDALFKTGGERQAAIALTENEPVLQTKLFGFSDALGRPSDGMTSFTIRIGELAGGGGFVQPEDKVDVFMTQADRVGGEMGGASKAYVVTLLRNVKVLAVDQQTQRRAAQGQAPKTVTLEVTSQDAKRLILASTIGQLSLTLNPGGAWNSVDSGIVDVNELLRLQPLKPAEAAPIDIEPVVTITRSVERKDYKVPDEVHR